MSVNTHGRAGSVHTCMLASETGNVRLPSVSEMERRNCQSVKG